MSPLRLTILSATALAAAEPLHLIVMDPLALPLSCACVDGVGQRRYDLLAAHLEKETGRAFTVTFDESLALALRRTDGKAHLVIGKDAMVRADADKAALPVRRLASLTDRAGRVTLRGVFLVPAQSGIASWRDLAGKRVSLGPVEDEEAHAAARAVLKEQHLDARVEVHSAGSMDAAALAMDDGESAAAVVSEHLPALLEGCGKLEKGSTRVLGSTASVPFIRVFATASVDDALEAKIQAALQKVAAHPALLDALESSEGFVRRHEDPADGWPDWRGPGRKGMVEHLPEKWPESMTPLWSAALTGPAMAGPAVSGGRVVIPDKTADGKHDVFSCLDAADGKPLWRLEYAAPDDMEYTNAPRATPVIHDGLVYLQGALGHLHCVELKSGRVVWRKNIFTDFQAERLTWGASVAPLIAGDKLIIAPGAPQASVVALDRRTGAALWQTPGNAAAYAAFIQTEFSGVAQIIGYDSGSLGGWDPETGMRLWTLVPPDRSDFNVTTPVVLGDKLLLATENNGTRLYGFDPNGVILPEPLAANQDLAPDTCTPAVAAGRAFATAYGELFCVSLRDEMQTLWQHQDDMFHDHCNILASPDRLLLWTANGDLLVLDARAENYAPLARLRPFDEKHPDTLAHPAIAGGRLYLRSGKAVACFALE